VSGRGLSMCLTALGTVLWLLITRLGAIAGHWAWPIWPVEAYAVEDRRARAGRPALAGPPPGHPERVEPSVTPSPVERELWKQLESITRHRIGPW
jgi:hypothetical protein